MRYETKFNVSDNTHKLWNLDNEPIMPVDKNILKWNQAWMCKISRPKSPAHESKAVA